MWITLKNAGAARIFDTVFIGDLLGIAVENLGEISFAAVSRRRFRRIRPVLSIIASTVIVAYFS